MSTPHIAITCLQQHPLQPVPAVCFGAPAPHISATLVVTHAFMARIAASLVRHTLTLAPTTPRREADLGCRGILNFGQVLLWFSRAALRPSLAAARAARASSSSSSGGGGACSSSSGGGACSSRSSCGGAGCSRGTGAGWSHEAVAPTVEADLQQPQERQQERQQQEPQQPEQQQQQQGQLPQQPQG